MSLIFFDFTYLRAKYVGLIYVVFMFTFFRLNFFIFFTRFCRWVVEFNFFLLRKIYVVNLEKAAYMTKKR